MSFFQHITPLKTLIILLFLSLLLLVFFLPKSSVTQKNIVSVTPIDTSISININFYIQQDKSIDSIIQLYNQNKIGADTLIRWLNKNGTPQIATYFEELKYLSSSLDTVWFYLGKNYYNSLGFISSMAESQSVISSAARCFNKALLLNPKNTNARIMLASCYVQSQSPMLGIQMLREIEKTDSNNVLLQLQMAEFSLRSNQLDKAIQRYKKALSIDSTKTEVYAYLSEIYLQKKDTLQSIQFLRKFAAHISDTALKNSIERYIEKLNKP